MGDQSKIILIDHPVVSVTNADTCVRWGRVRGGRNRWHIYKQFRLGRTLYWLWKKNWKPATGWRLTIFGDTLG